ncbi:DUF4381 domain-containing protein [Ancylobacter sp. 6x-1]|uniref:DUF4381 domain-containing protein n=1 Tax=Ancylobacter crimeensis TaxID=2579147 RepID=A0ABT0DF18_9HYPH|nr:DUF4381 domain-containing protein [Ancylobacter crimeensis]MCK0198546.1 DUF4381 domain-containing protein [Ancylobacter crimeensis]
MEDAADLSRLADIAVPPPVPWWPPAAGWWMIAAALLAALLILIAAGIRHWRRDAYRRAALAELSGLGSGADAAAISDVLKRTALAAYPRQTVASLTGSAWLAFLDRTGGTNDFTEAGGFAASVSGVRASSDNALLAAGRRWVKRHRVEG